MFADPLTLIILVLFLLFVCASLLVWFALTLRSPVTDSPAPRRAKRRRTNQETGAVEVKEGKHSSRGSEPAVALRGSAALMEDAQAKAQVRANETLAIEAERAARLAALKSQREAPTPNTPAPKLAPKPAAAPQRVTGQTPVRKVEKADEPMLERAKRESPFPTPPRYEPGEQGGQSVRVRPTSKNPPLSTGKPAQRQEPSLKPQPSPERPAAKQPEKRKAKPDAFEQFIRSKNDDFDL